MPNLPHPRVRSLLSALFVCTVLSAADADELSDRLSEVKGTMQSINGELSSQRAEIGRIKAEVNVNRQEQRSTNRELMEELKTLRRQNQTLIDAFIQPKEGSMNSIVGTPRNYQIQAPDGKMIFGEDEFAYIKEADATIAARVDTGAAVSSICATDIERFERGGKKMVGFTLQANERSIRVEAPFVRVTRIAQSDNEELSYRLVVNLQIKVGSYSTTSEFNLIDRTHLNYALLLGRSLLTDIAVVDVSRRYVQPRADTEGLLLLSRDDFKAAQSRGENPNAAYDEKVAQLGGGQTAYPDASYGANLGTDATKALPEVSDRLLKEEYLEQQQKLKLDPGHSAYSHPGGDDQSWKQQPQAEKSAVKAADNEKKVKNNKEKTKEKGKDKSKN